MLFSSYNQSRIGKILEMFPMLLAWAFTCMVICNPAFASWNLTKSNNLDQLHPEAKATFIGNAVSHFHCFLMCSRFVGENCELSFLENGKECFAPMVHIEETYIMTTYGYTLKEGKRTMNRKAELLQINSNKLAEEPNQAVIGHFPDARSAYAVGIILDNQPLVCGGSGVGENSEIHPLCYVLDKSRVIAFMEFPRSMSASLPILVDNEAKTLWITGGWTAEKWNRKSITNTTEFVSLDEEGSSSFGPVMPHGLAGHCLLQLNDTFAILTGGLFEGQQTPSSDTFYYDIGRQTFSQGPKSIVPRYGHSCGTVSLGQSGDQAAVVTGGHHEQTTEFLVPVKEDLKWIPGPKFPHQASFHTAAISAPDETLLVSGGQGVENDSVAFMFQLICKEQEGPILELCTWNKLDLELGVALAGHVMMMVSKNYAEEIKGNGRKEPILSPPETATNKQELGLLLVTGGQIGIKSNKKIWFGLSHDTEILDFSSNVNKQCDAAGRYLSHGRDFAVGGLLGEQVLVCGGGVRANGVDRIKHSYHADCQWLGPKTGSIKMREKRMKSSSILITKQSGNEQKLWVTGGQVGAFIHDKLYKILQTTEFVSPTQRFASPGPKLPHALTDHCMTYFNQSTIVILGGDTDGKQRKYWRKINWMLFDIDKGEMSIDEIKLSPRTGHVCGHVAFGQHQKAVVTAGGFKDDDVASSSDIMSIRRDGSYKWSRGPRLPIKVKNAAGVTVPNGGQFLVVGGRERKSRTVFQLACLTGKIQDCEWTKLGHELNAERRFHVALLVPNDFATCN